MDPTVISLYLIAKGVCPDCGWPKWTHRTDCIRVIKSERKLDSSCLMVLEDNSATPRKGQGMSAIVRPRFISLDSATLIKLSRDWWSRGHAEASSVRDAFLRNDCILVLTLAHLAELMHPHDANLFRSRLDFLKLFPILAWVKPYRQHGEHFLPGSIVDIDAWEVEAVYKHRKESLAEVVHFVREQIWQCGTGEQFIGDDEDRWEFFSECCMPIRERQKHIASVTRTDAAGVADVKLKEFMAGSARSADERERFLRRFVSRLTGQIRDHGDKRIEDANETAVWFTRTVVDRVSEAGEPSCSAMLRAFGLDDEDVDPEMTMAELGDLAHFAADLKVISRSLGRPLTVKDVPHDLCPSWVLRRELSRIQRTADRVRGSDISDGHLATLVLYVDAIEVDKRTNEYLSRVNRKDIEIAPLMGRFFRCSDYSQIPAILASLTSIGTMRVKPPTVD